MTASATAAWPASDHRTRAGRPNRRELDAADLYCPLDVGPVEFTGPTS
ncbi:MAG: hypothetical protein M3186_05500 [Actinomycetota bacterium]|nr:hypothetical protein [Actinomycetota bacterium]